MELEEKDIRAMGESPSSLKRKQKEMGLGEEEISMQLGVYPIVRETAEAGLAEEVLGEGREMVTQLCWTIFRVEKGKLHILRS